MIIERLSIRVRITIGTLVLAAAFFGGASILVQREFESVLDRASAAVLDSDASPYQAAIRNEPTDKFDKPGEDQLVAVVNPAGVVKLSALPAALTAKFSKIDLTDHDPQRISAGGKNYLVLVERQPSADGTWSIVAARSQATSALVLSGLTAGLGWGLVALTVIFGVVSWLLTGAALRPIVRLRRSAEQIAGSGSNELLPVGTVRDEVRDLATTLNTLIGQLRASAEREKQIVSDASHELRTPIAILTTQLELIRRADGPPSDADLLAAEQAASRMGDLVTNLLELSRLDAAGRTESASLDEYLAELVEAIDRARFRARSTAISVDYDVPSGSAGDPRGTMSAHDFGRVIDNLASNAIKALGQEGAVVVRLRIGEGAIVVDVDDDGPGMLEDFLPRATDRFSQQDDGRSGGIGLGLSIVAAAVRNAGGKLSISNKPEGGLRVSVRIPIRVDD